MEDLTFPLSTSHQVVELVLLILCFCIKSLVFHATTMSQQQRRSSSAADGQATTSVRQPLNVESLATWMTSNHELARKFQFHPVSSLLEGDPNVLHQAMTVRQFGFGQSNPTYLVEIQHDGSTFRAVLRKKPLKVAHPSAHALHREYQVLKAICKHNRLVVEKQVPVHIRTPTATTPPSWVPSFT